MLDVHPPHGPTHTWADFFIHMASICLGLLIAIGLEQPVEYIHHRHEVSETQRALEEERQENIRILHNNVERHVMAMAYLHNNFRIFDYLRDHPGTPQEKLPGTLYWRIFSGQPKEAAWTTAEHTDVLSLMPREKVSDISSTYATLDYSWQQYQPVVDALAQCTLYLGQTPDATKLPPAEIAAEIESLKLAVVREAIYRSSARMPGFGPIPSWWQMLPFDKMQDYYSWARQHPELNAPSQRDIDEARAHAGLQPEQSGASFNYFTTPQP